MRTCVQASGAMLQGACGYGEISKDSYPYWSVAALSLTNQFSVAGPAKACGECFEIKCVDIGGPFAVSAYTAIAACEAPCLHSLFWQQQASPKEAAAAESSVLAGC